MSTQLSTSLLRATPTSSSQLTILDQETEGSGVLNKKVSDVYRQQPPQSECVNILIHERDMKPVEEMKNNNKTTQLVVAFLKKKIEKGEGPQKGLWQVMPIFGAFFGGLSMGCLTWWLMPGMGTVATVSWGGMCGATIGTYYRDQVETQEIRGVLEQIKSQSKTEV